MAKFRKAPEGPIDVDSEYAKLLNLTSENFMVEGTHLWKDKSQLWLTRLYPTGASPRAEAQKVKELIDSSLDTGLQVKVPEPPRYIVRLLKQKGFTKRKEPVYDDDDDDELITVYSKKLRT